MCLGDFSSVKVPECPQFWKELLIRLTICSLCIMSICNFGSEGGTLVLIEPVSWSLLTCCYFTLRNVNLRLTVLTTVYYCFLS